MNCCDKCEKYEHNTTCPFKRNEEEIKDWKSQTLLFLITIALCVISAFIITIMS